MNTQFGLLLTLLAAASIAEGKDLPACPARLEPIAFAPPSLPAKLNNEFEGQVDVAVVIDIDGRVLDARILKVDLHPWGRATGEPFGYEEAIVSALKKFKYPKQQVRCRRPFKVHMKYS